MADRNGQTIPSSSMKASAIMDGINPQAVVAAIRSRALGLGPVTPEGKPRKLALVFEGGAMRAAAPAGGALALSHLGLSGMFDEVYATSAGVINASYFLSGQGDMGISIYFEDLTTGRFINPLRFWKMVDIDYVFDEVVTQRKPLNVDSLKASPTRFFAAVMDVAAGHARLIDVQRSSLPVLQVIKAALAIPVLYNRTVALDGIPSMDGGLHMPFPIHEAIKNGCTDILVLLSRSRDFVQAQPGWLSRFCFDLVCSRGRKGISHTFSVHHEHSRNARDLVFGRKPGVPEHVNVAVMSMDPAEEPLDRMTADPGLLRRAAISYGRRMMEVMGVDAADWALGPAESLRWKGAAQPLVRESQS